MTHPKKDVVLLNMSHVHDWQSGIVNRNRFVMDTLYRHPLVNNVLAVDFLPFHSKMSVKTFLTPPNQAELISVHPFGRVYKLANRCFVLQSWISSYSEKKFISFLEKQLSKLNFDHFLFWSYHPMFIKSFLHFRDQFLIFDAVDNWSLHASYHKYKQQLQENYQIIDEAADYVFTVSEELKELFPNNKDTYWIPNGVDRKHFEKKRVMPEDLLKIKQKGIVIGYVGTIQERVDFNLLASIASYHSDKQIVLLGPIWDTVRFQVETLKQQHKNIHFLGRVSYKDTPAYLQNFDVCIIPHRLNGFIRSTNSMKMYEYLACKKPVVSTPGSGVESFSDLIFIAKEYHVFNEKIDVALNQENPEKDQKRELLLSECTWEKRVNKMMHIILP